ncbi:Protein of unknown function [Microlunatus sagamiharensis]|uniref:Intracellular septation protein A n=1 Tax=Microlunatus sagamiharensis TaxID=546874 RepID=A0A1H2ML46_9ACTN|nr:DUF3159 domain-containing protein [Microlunatus sagamiharensis]SDU93745.1 Protein of unknown function [Microlunatus sagamiharensis]
MSAPAGGWSAVVREVLGRGEHVERGAVRVAADRALERVGGGVGLVAAAAPTVAFVATDAAAGLGPAFVALGATAVLACAVRLLRRESPGAALAGLVVAGLCAAVAALAGEARAFFLPTLVVPPLFVLAHLVSLVAGRPLMGLLVNPLAGGPRDWRRQRALRRTYLVSTLVALLLAAANLVVRVAFYRADEPAALAAVQVGANLTFALHFAVTFVVARRVAARLGVTRRASVVPGT